LEIPQESKKKTSTVVIVFVAVVMLVLGSTLGYLVGYTLNSSEVDSLKDQVSTVQEEVDALRAETKPAVENQSEMLEKIDALQAQLLIIRSQINSMEESNESNQNNDQIVVELATLQNQLTSLQQQINEIRNVSSITYENVTVVFGETVLPQLFEQVRDSVVVIEAVIKQTVYGRTVLTAVQGSGFVYNFTGHMVIITCNHVVSGASSINVTFSNGNIYTASLKGANANTDVAVLATTAPQSEFKPLSIINSSTLRVGDSVIVVGTPYGLEGSMSTGIVSATNRTIAVDSTTMTNMIQITAPLNPGNSGGPLMNYQGQVIGIADAIIQESQGIGLAVPSNTILQDITKIMG
jgi:S1-C subfamily serine protease